jgi:hypothetical protein
VRAEAVRRRLAPATDKVTSTVGVALTTVALFGWHLWLARGIAGWTQLDEIGYLSTARYFVTGGGLVEPLGRAPYKIGPSLVAAPIFWFTTDPLTAFRWATIINAALAACCYPVALGLLQRLFTALSRRRAALAALAVAAYPPLAYYANTAFGNCLFVVLLLLHASAGAALWRTPSLRAGAVFAGSAASLYLTHESGLPALVLAPVYLALIVRRSDLTPSRRAWFAAIGLAGLAIVPLLTGVLEVPGTQYDTLASGTSMLRRAWDHPRSLLICLGGQLLYVFAATLGSVAFAPAAIASALTTGSSTDATVLRRLATLRNLWLVAVIGGTASILFLHLQGTFASRPIAGYALYGRYADGIVPLIIAIAFGLILLPSPRARTEVLASSSASEVARPFLLATAGLLGLGAAMSAVGASTVLAESGIYVPNSPGLYFLWRWIGTDLPSLLFGIICVFTLVALSTYVDRRAGAVVAIAVMVYATVTVTSWHRTYSHQRQRDEIVDVLAAIPNPDKTIFVHDGTWVEYYYYNYDFLLADFEFPKVGLATRNWQVGDVILTTAEQIGDAVCDARLEFVQEISPTFSSVGGWAVWVVTAPGSPAQGC